MPLPARSPRGQRRYRSLLSVLGICTTVLTAAPASAQDTTPGPSLPAAARTKIDPVLLKRMDAAEARGDGRVEAVVVLRHGSGTPAPGGAEPGGAAASDTAADVRRQLTRGSESDQAPVVDLVESRGDQVLNTFWLKDMVLVKAAPDTLDELAAMAPVDHVIPNFTLQTPPGETVDRSEAAVAEATAHDTTWGLAKIGADKVQSERNLTGAGVRVAVLDTGIDIDHPDLAGKLASDDPADPTHPGGWIEFDTDGNPVPGSVPHDSSYHGTHVAGTIAGGDASGTQIGVAPGAELMGGIVIPGGSGSLAQVIAGMQWAIAPYDDEGRPAGKPADVVSMSLGQDGYADELVEPARNIARAGIFPSFAIGNECVIGSASPGNVYESASVGATDSDDNVPDFSCGEVVKKSSWSAPPAEWPDSYVVPDVSAPGVDVLSALPGGGYGTLDGTSMATPHVSGTVALMLQAQPDLSVDEALAVLTGTSFSDDRYGERPNPRYGYGRIDAYAAVKEASLNSGVHGTVTDARTGDPLKGVTVTRTDTGRSVTTDQDGHFSFRLAPGTHELTLSRFGYESTRTSLRVGADQYTDAGLELTPTRRGTITGTVTYGPTGSTVPGATVGVLDVPDGLTAVTDDNGRYTIREVPVGTYQVRATAPGISRSQPLTVTVNGKAGPDRTDPVLPRVSATDRVSLTSQGGQPNDDAWWPRLSDDGQVVAYASPASNLVADDTNGTLDIFVTDRGTQTTERVSVASDGTESDDFSLSPTLTADGRYVGFSSGATDLVPGDTGRQTDSFVHDRTTGTTERVSVASDGTQADGLSSAPSLSADGRYAVFDSDADNLVPDDTNNTTDVFLHDRQTGTTVRVSQAADGAPGNGGSREESISADGRYIAFQSRAENLVPGDTDGQADVFVYDRVAGTTTHVDGPAGENSSPRISADGHVVTFLNGWQAYVHDLRTGDDEQVSVTDGGVPADGFVYASAVNEDGTKVAFFTDATNLAPGDTNPWSDVYVRDLTAGTTTWVSGGLEGAAGDGASDLPSFSGDGRHVVFESTASNLVGEDTNHHSDVFVHDLVAGAEALFALSDLSVTPSRARAGAPVQVTARVKNVGDTAGTYTAVLRVAGETEQQRPVTVGAGRDARIRFTVRREAAGTYALRLGPLSGQFTVLE